MISSEGPGSSGRALQGCSDFLQQVGRTSPVLPEAEDRMNTILAASRMRMALEKIQFFRCMVVVFGFDENSDQNVTANLNRKPPASKQRRPGRLIRVMEGEKAGMKCGEPFYAVSFGESFVPGLFLFFRSAG